MQYRTLGNTGLQVSRLGFGGIPIQKTDREQTRRLMLALAENGINYIDTARGYTVSEEYLGYGLEGIRDQFILATKSRARTREGMEKDIRTSLSNLRTDRIELYQIHNPNAADLEQVVAPGGALEALLAAKAEGKILHIGITLHSLELFQKALELSWVETIMFPYNIVETQAKALIAACHQKGIGFIAMKPLAGGALEDATLALRFLTADENVDVIIPGMAEEKELYQNMQAVCSQESISPEEQKKMEAIRLELGSHFCRRCNYCAPCTAGISIPAVFLMEGYYRRYDLKEWAAAQYQAMEKKASDCIGCGVCETRCPYQLPIRQMMQAAAKVFGE